MSFEVFVPRRTVTDEPRVNIRPSGIFWFNPATTGRFFEGFTRVFLLYDKGKRLIGFKPTNEQENTYLISRHVGRKTSTVTGRAFLKHYRILHSATKSYGTTWNDKQKLLEVDLNRAL